MDFIIDLPILTNLKKKHLWLYPNHYRLANKDGKL